MAQAGTLKSYIPNGNSFTEDVNGYLKGVEWTKSNGNMFRVIYTHEPRQLDLISKIMDYSYVIEMKEATDTVWFFRTRKNFDGTEYINTNFGNAKYGKLVNTPFLADGITLKPNTVTFIDYFITHIMNGVNPPIPLSTTLLDIAATKENVTLP
jgi:hypothetical protein